MRYWRQLLLIIAVAGLVPIARSQAPVIYRVPISGKARDAQSGAPIAGARLSLAGTEVVSGADGRFPATEVALDRPLQKVDVRVTAEHYHPWSFQDVPLSADQPIEFRVRMRRLAPGEQPEETPVKAPDEAEVRDEPLPPEEIVPVAPEDEVSFGPEPSDRPATATPSPALTPTTTSTLAPTIAAPTTLPVAPAARNVDVVPDPPEYIYIGLTGSTGCNPDPTFLQSIPVVRVRFFDYVREVLPNEWVTSWPQASLEAGAIAAKQFAWYNAFDRPKWRPRGYAFDLLDSTCDQVYKPGTARAATDRAIAATWKLVLTREGELFPAYYRSYYALCPASVSCMGQWDSKYMADAGATSIQILLAYYRDAVVEEVGVGPVRSFSRCAVSEEPLPGPQSPSEPLPSNATRIYLPVVVQCRG